jgi:hypothetical protein
MVLDHLQSAEGHALPVNGRVEKNVEIVDHGTPSIPQLRVAQLLQPAPPVLVVIVVQQGVVLQGFRSANRMPKIE